MPTNKFGTKLVHLYRLINEINMIACNVELHRYFNDNKGKLIKCNDVIYCINAEIPGIDQSIAFVKHYTYAIDHQSPINKELPTGACALPTRYYIPLEYSKYDGLPRILIMDKIYPFKIVIESEYIRYCSYSNVDRLKYKLQQL